MTEKEDKSNGIRIGIDISQLAYPNTGVANILRKLIDHLLEVDKKNNYVLFFSSMRGKLDAHFLRHQKNPQVQIKFFKFPPTVLDLLWNRLHILPINYLIGQVDVFITSDWTEPPIKNSKKATIIYDMVVFKSPEETHEKIVETQKRKLKWAKKESDVVFTISKSSKKDIEEILRIEGEKIKVVYPGY